MELTQKQIDRQDFVDNSIFTILQTLSPADANIEWNIEYIGQIRDSIQDVIVKELNLCDEQTFYPYLEE